MCEVTSWLPPAVASTLQENHSAAPVLAWLSAIRDKIEEYDPLVTVRPTSPEPDTARNSPDSAFDEILSQLGKEIFKLDEYQRNLDPLENEEISLSILNIFDECLGEIKKTEVLSENSVLLSNKEIENEIVVEPCVVKEPSEKENTAAVVNGATINSEVVEVIIDEESDAESTLSNVAFVASTPVKMCETEGNPIELNCKRNGGVAPPVPPRRTKFPTSTNNDNNTPVPAVRESRTKSIMSTISNSDSESTCWSYKECSDDEIEKSKDYAVLWSHSSGYHNSDEILRRVLLQHHAIVSRLSFDTASDFAPSQYSVYALHEQEVGDRCLDNHTRLVSAMTPERPADDGYEPVLDAITTDENIYEEIEYGCSYTDEGCSCGGSVEVESCSISASSEGVGRESPVYANLRDHDAYAVPSDVIAWKNSLLHPLYNEDEEDEWITPEDYAEYSREQVKPLRAPLVIPRITHCRVRSERPRPHNLPLPSYTEDSSTCKTPSQSKLSSTYDRFKNWSPSSDRYDMEFSKGGDSPTFGKLNSRLGGSTENLLSASVSRRANHLLESSSGDSLDVEVRVKESGASRNRKSRSMMAKVKSPVPVPRGFPVHPHAGRTFQATIILEGPVRRTKFSENGKKCKKNWTDSYMLLTHSALVFFKDQKTYQATRQLRPPGTPPSPSAPRVELVLPLRNAYIVNCIQNHTRRYTRTLLLTIDHDQYLIQDEHEEGARRWQKCVRDVIYGLGPMELGEPITPQYQSSSTDLESIGRTPPPARHNRNKKAGGSSNEDLSDSTEVFTNKSHVAKRLKKFFAKRPAMETLIKKGIYKDEPVFGKKLEEVCPPSSPRVPEFVVACIREIERSEENMSTDGLYRASGNLSQVQKIRLEIDQNNLSVIENTSDIHVLTGSLKLFFRELKEPLIPFSVFDRVLAACSKKPREARTKEFREIVHALPQCNRDTLKYLLEHLLRVTDYKESNRMHTANLAIVFGPTLLWAPAAQAHNIAIDCIQQNNVVDILLTDFNEIFAEDSKAKKKT